MNRVPVLLVALALALTSVPAPTLATSAREGFFVGFRAAPGAAERALVERHGGTITAEFPEVAALAVQLDPRSVGTLARARGVAYVERDPVRYAAGLSDAELVPALDNGLYGLITTKADLVHDRGVTGAGVRACVADTSIDRNHPDIKANYKGGTDTVGVGDSDPINDDGETHGTHVAGTILGVDNRVGIYGVAYDADLYYARVLGPDGGTTSDVMEGVRWLADQGCKVVNLSLGGGAKSRTEENFFKQIRKEGILVVAAAGNDGRRMLLYPAGYAVNISVAAVDRTNTLASFSNTGRNLDISAPGVGVLSSVPIGQGSESSVTVGGATHPARGMEFAPKTDGVTGALVDCGIGDAGDCPAAVAGNVALIQRGTLSFADKVANAKAAGATAAIIYNNVAGEFSGTLGAEGDWIPAVSVSDTVGATLRAQVGSSATVVDKLSDWDHYDGTSMATPHVTGVAALIWSANPSLSVDDVETLLLSTATNLGVAGYDTTYGYGLVNADAAVRGAGR